MRGRVLFFFCLIVTLLARGQAVAGSAKTLPKDPRAMLAAAAPFYDFSDPSLKPWHMRVGYQLYDENGKPAEKGAFDYWWASPTIYRATWTRSGSSYTVWHTADGKESEESIGNRLEFFERQLESALLTPLPAAEEVDSGKYRLDRQIQSVGKMKLRCVMVVPKMQPQGPVQAVSGIPLGLFPTYCFDPDTPALRMVFSWGSVAEVFNRFAKVQGRYLPQEAQFFEAGHPILTASMELVTDLDPSDSALKPAPDAQVRGKPGRVPVDEKIINGYLIKKTPPVYPADAKEAHAAGTVEIRAIIGTDGMVHEMQIVKAPWPSLVASAMWAVSQWQYKPYLLNGQPVEVETTIKVIYKLGP